MAISLVGGSPLAAGFHVALIIVTQIFLSTKSCANFYFVLISDWAFAHPISRRP
jgi:hypothetical protein